ncbi:hypothetical protein BLOT_011253 [Blomia tropicalis]|nr:hypothetical protein BLOT_011253 [Blomia tropicalis]
MQNDRKGVLISCKTSGKKRDKKKKDSCHNGRCQKVAHRFSLGGFPAEHIAEGLKMMPDAK